MSVPPSPQADPRPHETRRSRPTLAAIAWAAFGLTVWLTAALGLGGDLGRSTDDYCVNLRDPVTGDAPRPFNPFAHHPSFWRPAHVLMMYAGRTYLDDQDRILHVFTAAMFGGTAVLLFVLLRRSTGSLLIASAAAILLLAWPSHHEVALWFPTTCTSIGTGLLLALGLATRRLAHNEPRRFWPHTLLPLSLAAAIPFFYEQPAAASIAVPLLYVAARGPSLSRAAHLRRAVKLLSLIAGIQCTFAAAMIATTAGAKRGGTDSLVGLSETPGRILATVERVAAAIGGPQARNIFAGGWTEAWTQLPASLVGVWVVALAICGAATVLATAHRPTALTSNASESAERSRPGWIIAFGLCVSLLSLMPIAAIRDHVVASRMTFVPFIGVLIAGAGLLAFIRALRLRMTRTTLTSAMFAIAVVAGAGSLAIAMLGVQLAYKRRAELDDRALRQLATLVPNPPSNSVFVPVAVADRAATTGFPAFDNVRPGVFETIWSSSPPLRRMLTRRDIWVTSRPGWRGPTLAHPSRESVLLNHRFLGWCPFELSDDGRGTILEWSDIIPFIVEADGRVRLIRRLTFERSDGEDLVIRPPLVHQALARDRLSVQNTATYRLRFGESPQAFLAAGPWFLPDQHARVEPLPASAWGTTRPAMWLHPTARDREGRGRSAVSLEIPPDSAGARLVLRATVTPFDLDRRATSEPSELRFAWDDQPPSHTLAIDRARVRAWQGWAPIVIDVPQPAPRLLRVSMHYRSDADPSGPTDPVWLSTGHFLSPDPTDTADSKPRTITDSAGGE